MAVPTFANRRDAGRRLAAALADLAQERPVVLALPRGGVPVGYEVAQALDAPLDVLMVRKIGAPGHEEYGIGALVDGAAAQIVIDEAAARAVGASQDYIDRIVARELAEIERRRKLYNISAPIQIAGRCVILVDDGIATGATVRAALKGLAKVQPAKIVLAVPVAARDTLQTLAADCDRIVCLAMPDPFYAVGMHYLDFGQTDDREVIALLAASRKSSAA